MLYYEEAHFGHGGHYQSIRPAQEPASEVEQPTSEPIVVERSTENSHLFARESNSQVIISYNL